MDGATGSWWKPDINEKGVIKIDYNHYVYTIDYENCSTTPQEDRSDKPSIAELLRELKKLLDEGIITQEEFETEKKRILNREY